MSHLPKMLVLAMCRPLCFALCLALAACSSLPVEERSDIRDPYERGNRRVFAFNLEVDDWLLEPIAKGYLYLPAFSQDMLTNFADWTGQPSTAINSALQGRGENAMLALLNFLINGVTLGLADLTNDEDDAEPTDFNDTLVAWRTPPGQYIVAPFIGPGTVRSQLGFVVDIFLNPLQFASGNAVDAVQLASTPVNIVTARGNNFDLINDIKYNSLDPYSRTRSLYFQFTAPDDGGDNESELSGDDDFDSFIDEDFEDL